MIDVESQIKGLIDDLEASRQENEKLKSLLAEKDKMILSLNSDIKSWGLKFKDLEFNFKNKETELRETLTLLEQRDLKLKENSEAMEKMQAELEKLAKEIEELKGEKVEAEKKINELNIECDTLDERNEYLEELNEELKKITMEGQNKLHELEDEKLRLGLQADTRLRELEEMSHKYQRVLLKHSLSMCVLDAMYLKQFGPSERLTKKEMNSLNTTRNPSKRGSRRTIPQSRRSSVRKPEAKASSHALEESHAHEEHGHDKHGHSHGNIGEKTFAPK